MKCFLRLLLMLPGVLSAPALAGFTPAEQVQPVRLAFAQTEATVVFRTSDGSTVTKAHPLCNCMTLKLDGSRLVAQVDVSTFDVPVDKQIEVTTSDGKRCTLTLRFDAPQAVIINTRSLVWERNAAPSPQEFRITLPKGSPVRALLSADLAGEDFDYTTRTITPGREYAVSVTPRSTARRALNRLVIKMDGPDPRYRQRILYLRIQ